MKLYKVTFLLANTSKKTIKQKVKAKSEALAAFKASKITGKSILLKCERIHDN